jgi:hypothetical protein
MEKKTKEEMMSKKGFSQALSDNLNKGFDRAAKGDRYKKKKGKTKK